LFIKRLCLDTLWDGRRFCSSWGVGSWRGKWRFIWWGR